MRLFRNEKGIALVMVLVVSLICLAIVSALIYLVIQGTRSSAFLKRYETAHDAGGGGAEITTALINNRGNLVIPGIANFPNACVCGFDSNLYDAVYPDPSPNSCLCRKLCLPTSAWGTGVCTSNSNSFADVNDVVTSYDMQFSLSGVGTNYQVSAKLVDTTIGVTDLSGQNLGCGTGVGYVCGTIQGPATPYLYRLEINAQDADPAKVMERARLSVLYGF